MITKSLPGNSVTDAVLVERRDRGNRSASVRLTQEQRLKIADVYEANFRPHESDAAILLGWLAKKRAS